MARAPSTVILGGPGVPGAGAAALSGETKKGASGYAIGKMGNGPLTVGLQFLGMGAQPLIGEDWFLLGRNHDQWT
jgi:hypothetical protein